MKIEASEVFDYLSGNSDINEEFIYNNLNSSKKQYIVLSSSTQERTQLGKIPLCKNSKGKYIKTFENKHGILIARNGNAGTMNYLSPGYYTINDHAYILFLKRNFLEKYELIGKEEIFLKFFVIMYQNDIYKFATKNDNSTWSITSFLKGFVFDMYDLNLMKTIVDKWEKIKEILTQITASIHNLLKLQKKALIVNMNEEPIYLKEILDYTSRNDSLSEETIYNHAFDGKGEYIKVLSGSLVNLHYGNIKKLDNIHTINDQVLHVISRGKAGTLTYLQKNQYATNTNAFLFYLRDTACERLNIKNEEDKKNYLKFLGIYLQPIFINLSSESDLGVFPLTKIMNEQKLPFLPLNDEIRKIVKSYDNLLIYLKKIADLKCSIEKLLIKQIAI